MLSSPNGNAILKQAKPVLDRVVDLVPEVRSFRPNFFESLEFRLRLLYAFARGNFNSRGFLNTDTKDSLLRWVMHGHLFHFPRPLRRFGLVVGLS